MTMLGKSIRKCMNAYGPALRARKYWTHEMTGVLPDNFRGYIKKVALDIDQDRRICTDATIYVVGDGMSPEHYHGNCLDVADLVVEWLNGYEIEKWSDLLSEIEKAANAYLDNPDMT